MEPPMENLENSALLSQARRQLKRRVLTQRQLGTSLSRRSEEGAKFLGLLLGKGILEKRIFTSAYGPRS